MDYCENVTIETDGYCAGCLLEKVGDIQRQLAEAQTKLTELAVERDAGTTSVSRPGSA